MTQPVATVQDREGAEPAPADYGLFGPGSATWQLMGEPILWVGEDCLDCPGNLRRAGQPGAACCGGPRDALW
jgi:hypothetical protein